MKRSAADASVAMAAAVVGMQWHHNHSARLAKSSSNAPLVVAVSHAKSISLKSVSAAAAAAGISTTPKTTASRVAVVFVASSQQSSVRIKRSNRPSRFGEPLTTTDCYYDDDDLIDLLSSDFQTLEMEFLDDGRNGQHHRKGKKSSRAGEKRLDSSSMAASPKVLVKQVQQKGGRNPEMKHQQQRQQQQAMSDGLKRTRMKSGAAGIKFKSPRARPSVDDAYFTMGDKPLSRRAWEEQAYQIIRRQKMRDAAAVAEDAGRIAQEAQKGPEQILMNEPLVSSTANGSVQHVAAVTVDVVAKEGGQVSSMSRRLGLEDKCEALVAYLHSLGVREREFIRIVGKHKTSLQANVNVVRERIEFLLSVGVQPQHLPKIIVRHPQIVEYRVEQAMKPRVQYLKSLGLDESKIGKIITISPSLLECSLERSIKPRLVYLVKNVGIKSEDISKIVMRSPQVLTQSIEDALEPRLDFYLNELKLSKEALAKMITRHPQLLHYSIEDGVRPRVNYLRSLGMSHDDVIKVVTRLTQILSLSVENCLQPKYTYLVNELQGGVHTVTSFPAYFSLSLDQRIVPRHRYSRRLEKTPEGPFPMRLLTVSDVAFCQWAKSSVEAYDKFRQDHLLSAYAKKFERKNKVHM